MHLETCNRPDPASPVGQLSHYVQILTQQHIGAAEKDFGYLIVTKKLETLYSGNMAEVQQSVFTVDGYCDSDWGNDSDTRQKRYRIRTLLCWRCNINSFQTQKHCGLVNLSRICRGTRSLYGRTGAPKFFTANFLDSKPTCRLGIENQVAYVIAMNSSYSRRKRHVKLRWHSSRDPVAK